MTEWALSLPREALLVSRQVVCDLMPPGLVRHEDMIDRFHAGIIVQTPKRDNSDAARLINAWHE